MTVREKLWMLRQKLVEEADRVAASKNEYDRGWRAAMITAISYLDVMKKGVSCLCWEKKEDE